MSAKPAAHILDALRVRDLLELLDDVCRCHHVPRDSLCARVRTQAISRARQELWWRIRQHPDLHYSYQEIADIFARDHSTIVYGVGAHQRRRSGVAP